MLSFSIVYNVCISGKNTPFSFYQIFFPSLVSHAFIKKKRRSSHPTPALFLRDHTARLKYKKQIFVLLLEPKLIKDYSRLLFLQRAYCQTFYWVFVLLVSFKLFVKLINHNTYIHVTVIATNVNRNRFGKNLILVMSKKSHSQ